jgi:small GTP-binding protein
MGFAEQASKHGCGLDEPLHQAGFPVRTCGFPKTESFKIGMLGSTVAGKSTLLRSIISKENPPCQENLLYDDTLTHYHWQNVGDFFDVPALIYNPGWKGSVREFLKNAVDLALYIIPASTRIHRDDVNPVSAVLKCGVPCIIVLNKFDFIAAEQEDKLLSYITKQTDCPAVPVSALTGANVDLLRSLIQKISRTQPI